MSAPTTLVRTLLFAAALALSPTGMAPAIGAEPKAIPFEFTDLDGRPIRAKDLRGQWVLVNFWAPWCPLCKVLVPTLNELDRRPDLAVIGVCLDYGGNAASVRDAIEQYGLRYHANIAAGARRDPHSPHRQVGPVDFFPTSYLYAPDGEVVMFLPGQIRSAKILSFMDNWRAGRPAAPTYAMNKAKFASVLKRQYGQKGAEAYEDWRRLVEQSAATDAPGKLKQVNEFFNRRIQPASDRQVWRRDDHWTTPGELLGVGRGDGEDFAIAKYFTLLAMNIPAERLRLVYTRPAGAGRQTDEAVHIDVVHIVLAYYESLDREPLLLDHRVAEVMPASRRPDLRPVYTFNSLGTWGDTPAAGAGDDAERLAIWEDTLRRTRQEGFE